MQRRSLLLLSVLIFSMAACTGVKVSLFPDSAEPLKEITLSGTGTDKVLVIAVRGAISDQPGKGFSARRPTMVQEIVAQLRKAEKDKHVKALLLKLETPGGSVTASDILYHEILAFKSRTRTKVVAAMMGVTASGGVYISLPADYIMAHPTTVTGSVGVIFIQPKFDGLMTKLGLGVEVHKFGRNKDMMSPFRPATDEEQRLLEDLTGELGSRFLGLVQQHRRLTAQQSATVATARIFLAPAALDAGLVDGIGYLDDALAKARALAGLSPKARVVVYRRTQSADDNIYAGTASQAREPNVSVVDIDFPTALGARAAGFYYLWMPVAAP